jgi:hypothetical protein
MAGCITGIVSMAVFAMFSTAVLAVPGDIRPNAGATIHRDATLNGPLAAARYNQAGALYRGGRFEEALELYESLIAGGVRNPDLYYNAANAAYRTGNVGKAVLYLERALRLSPSDQDALANLEFINSVKQDKESPGGNAVSAFLERWYGSITINGAAVWSGILFVVVMACATCALFFPGWKRTVLISSAAAFFLSFAACTGVLIQKTHHAATTTEAVVMAREIDVYSGPGRENTHIFSLHEGTKVVIERRQDAWWLIRLKSGVGGWAAGDSLEVL